MRTRKRGVIHGSALLGLVLLLAGSAQAADHAVTVGPGFVFTPAAITIAQGDTVTWTWAGGLHSVTSGANCVADLGFDSGASGTIGNTFTSPAGAYDTPGVYEYHCAVGVHCAGFNMKGTVTVEAAPPAAKVPSMGTWALWATALVMAAMAVWIGFARSRRPDHGAKPARQA